MQAHAQEVPKFERRGRLRDKRATETCYTCSVPIRHGTSCLFLLVAVALPVGNLKARPEA
jgi:hypothetical protein